MDTQKHTESPWAGVKEVMTLALPIMMGTMSFTVMQFVDNKMVSMLGDDALAAIVSAGIWSFTLAAFFIGIVACVSTFVSQSIGRGMPQECGQYAWQGMYISLVTGLLALVLWPLTPAMFQAMGHPISVTDFEVEYFQIRLLGFVFIAQQAVLFAFFQAIGRPIIPTAVAIGAILLNVLLDYVLIFGHWGFPEWGIGGAAFATVLSLMVQVIALMVIFLSKPLDRSYATRESYRLNLVKITELIRIGWPSGLYMVMDITVWSVFITLIIGRFGEAALAANGAAITFMHVGFMPAVGVHHAMTPIVGRWIGLGNIPMAKARTYTAIKIAVAYMLTVGIILSLFGPTLMRFFSHNEEVISMGSTFLIFCAIFMGFDAVGIVCSGSLRGAGDTRFMAITTFASAYCFFLPVATVLAIPLGLGAAGAWMGATAYIILISAIMFTRFRGEKWRHITIFADEEAADQGTDEALIPINPEGP